MNEQKQIMLDALLHSLIKETWDRSSAINYGEDNMQYVTYNEKMEKIITVIKNWMEAEIIEASKQGYGE